MAALTRTGLTGLTAGPCLHRPARTPSSRRVMLVRASNDSKVVREYREDEDKVVVPNSEGVEKRADGLYVNEASRPVMRKDNMSREMKERLRKEYVGFGGAENQVAAGLPSRGPVVALLSLAEPETEPATASAFTATAPGSSSSSNGDDSGAPSSSGRPLGSSKWVIDQNELLASTWEHRLWTWGTMGLMGAGVAEALAQIHSTGDAKTVGLALIAAYLLSDLGTGVYHWGVDNYGDGNTPMFGRQIAAFQGHHQRPWTITQREFCNNVHQVFKPAALPAAIILALSPELPLAARAFLPSFLFLVCMSQQFHAWSHMKKSQLPGYIVALQDANILISRKAHGAHHKPNFEGNYCIVNGWWNPLLDNTGFFRWLEEVVNDATGVEPRCWYPPESGWVEEAAPERVTAAGSRV